MGGETYYNEHDTFAAAWLRELIADGHIAPGEVDERSIEDVRPSDLAGFVQCHFFAGIGIWSLALRQAGWPDDAPIWTGSCPCQPFSAAGKGGGFDDERHLWPAFHWLIEQCGPQLILGEQVASKDGLAWLDLVSADVEASGYAFGATDTCAAGFGAPHIRQRLYWMADASHELDDRRGSGRSGWWAQHSDGGAVSRLGDSSDERPQRLAVQRSARPGLEGTAAERAGTTSRLADALRSGTGYAPGQGVGPEAASDGSDGHLPRQRCGLGVQGEPGGVADPDRRVRRSLECSQPGISERQGAEREGSDLRPGPLNGLWRDADWLCCTDGKWRPVAPGTFPLAPAGTVRNRVGTLRGAGNAINLAQAQGFVEAVIEVRSLERESLAA